MDLNIKLKKEFEEIINYFKFKGEMHSKAEAKTRSFIKFLLEQTDHTRKRLSELIKVFNYESIKRDKQFRVWPDLELWRGVDDYGSRAMLNYDGGVADIEDQENIVIGQLDNYTIPPDSVRLKELKESQSIKIDIKKYPISHLGYHENRFDQTALFYAWIAYVWQAVEGHKCGIKVRTVENNSIAMFSLNDFLDEDFSEYMEASYGDKPERLANPFPRKLSLIELFLRASQTSYPFNPFSTYWRYFEKDSHFMEIGTYEFKTGIRQGSHSERQHVTLSKIQKHANSKQALLHIRDFTNQMIHDGWIEKLRPLDLPSKFDDHSFQFGYWTGIHWSEDQSAKLQEEDVRKLEESLEIKLPKNYFNYLRILNGRQHNAHQMFFPINDLYTVKMKKFYNIEEVSQYNTIQSIQDSDNLIIGESIDSTQIGIIINPKNRFYHKVTMLSNGKIKECNYTFELFVKYAQHSPKQPEIYAAEENDAEFLKKRLMEGWNYNTSYPYQNAVSQAASHNSYEALEVLLKAGARLKHKKYRQHMKSTYDEKTMDLLDKYHKEE